MNIARINPINFNGNIRFKCFNKDNPNEPTTEILDANEVAYRHGIGDGNPNNHSLPMWLLIEPNTTGRIYRADFYTKNLISETDIKEAYNKAKDNKSEAQKILSEKEMKKFATIRDKFNEWIEEAKNSEGDIDCPIDVVFIKKEF